MNSNLYIAMQGFNLSQAEKQLVLEELIGINMPVTDLIFEINDLLKLCF